MPGLDWNGAEKLLLSLRALVRSPRVVTAPVRAGPSWKAPLSVIVWFAWGFECFLSRWRRVFVYLWFYGRNLGQILRGCQR